ncbi:gas vesicle protein [Natronococcus occultus]|uniref:Gas vesicle protein n=1 Tax=Natronococcus occultus SP4 TaxID=694430 RepID=L0K4B1_9EURY|nr:gas vesicle protein [Natronococcus occultus]AGB39846.1 Gas vesicle protein [Natronococcus occultus SP4]
MSIEANNAYDSESGLAGAVDRILDKGLVINADITIDVAGTELLGIKVRAALASFETAAEYGLEFPAGTEETKAYAEARARNETCPQCVKRVEKEVLLNDECPWCGWQSARSKRQETETDRVADPLENKRSSNNVDGNER